MHETASWNRESVKSFLLRWGVTTVAVLVAANVVKGIAYDGLGSLLVASLLLGLLNAFLRPILTLLSLPLIVFSLGLFMLVINALLLYLVGALVGSFEVASFWSAFWGSLVIGLISLLANLFLGANDIRSRAGRTETSRYPPGRGGGPGPVIDV